MKHTSLTGDRHHNSRDDVFRWNGAGIAPTARSGRSDLAGNGDIRGSMRSGGTSGAVLESWEREDAILARARRRAGLDGGGA